MAWAVLIAVGARRAREVSHCAWVDDRWLELACSWRRRRVGGQLVEVGPGRASVVLRLGCAPKGCVVAVVSVAAGVALRVPVRVGVELGDVLARARVLVVPTRDTHVTKLSVQKRRRALLSGQLASQSAV